MLAACYFTLLTKITGDEFFTNGKGRETLGSTRASRYSDWYDPGQRFLYVKRNAFGTTREVGWNVSFHHKETDRHAVVAQCFAQRQR